MGIKKIHIQAKIDIFFLAMTVGLVLFGLLMIFEASSATAYLNFSDKYYFLKEQAKWIIIGFFLMITAMYFPYKNLYKLALPGLLISLLLLAAVFIPNIGIKALGAHRWIDFKFFVFQPAELAKLSLILYLAAWFSHPEKKRLTAFLMLCGLFLGLIILEPDLGTAIILGSVAGILYFLSGAPIFHFIFLIPFALLSILFLTKIAPYRFQRLNSFLNPTADPLGASYHVRQILISLGSGGLLGLGLGQSRQKYEYLPEAKTDSIFAIVAEELGFMGAAILIILFLIIIWRGFKIAKNAPDNFGRLLAAGISSWIGLQVLLNLSGMVALLPLTGVPLPFISYGGSALIVEMIGVGILLNISGGRG